MKTLILTFVLVAGFTVVSHAQNENKPLKKEVHKNLTPEEQAKHDVQIAAKKLTLTTQQQTDWETAALKRNIANKPLKDKLDGSTTPEERKELHKQVKANNDAFKLAVVTFLTPDQIVKMDEMERQHHGGKAHHPQNEMK